MKKTLSIGGATYDLFVRLPVEALPLPLGAKIRVKEVMETCGGGASNTSVGLSRLGCDACFEGVLSSDLWGEKLLKNLQAEGVDTHCVTIVEDEVSSFSIILSGESGERVILYEPGTNAHLHDVTFDKHLLDDMDWVYLNHIQEGSWVIQNDIVEMLSEADTGLTWNPGGCQLDTGIEHEENRKVLGNTDLLLLNKEEVLKFTKTNTIDDAMRMLLDAGVRNITITDGKNGTTATDGKDTFHVDVIETEIIDTTGAGDAFGTGVTWGLLQGMALIESVKKGSINAASVVGAIGAQTGLLTETDINT